MKEMGGAWNATTRPSATELTPSKPRSSRIWLDFLESIVGMEIDARIELVADHRKQVAVQIKTGASHFRHAGDSYSVWQGTWMAASKRKR